MLDISAARPQVLLLKVTFTCLMPIVVSKTGAEMQTLPETVLGHGLEDSLEV